MFFKPDLPVHILCVLLTRPGQVFKDEAFVSGASVSVLDLVKRCSVIAVFCDDYMGLIFVHAALRNIKRVAEERLNLVRP